MSNTTAELLDAWLSQLARDKLLMADREALRAELGAWLELLERGAAGDAGAHAELLRFVALHCKGLGYDGRPASAVVMQVTGLEDALVARGTPPDSKLRSIAREMIRVAADAQALGQSERLQERAQNELKHRSPVFRLPTAVVGCLVGGMRAELMDSLLGRVLRECTRHGLDQVILDLSSADEPDDRFFRTIQGLFTSPDVPPVSVTLTGLRDLDSARAALQKLGVDTRRLRLSGELGEVVSAR